MSEYTATTVIGARLAAKLAPVLSPDLERLCDAIGAMCEPLAEVIEDTGLDGEDGYVPSYGKLLNPETCPGKYLPFLGNFVGVSIPVGTPEEEARAIIKAESGLERGTRASVESAIERSIAPFWTADTAFLKGQLVRHTEGTITTCYEVTANFTSGSSFATTHLTVVNIATQYELLERERADGESNAYYFTILCHGYQLTPEDNLAQMEARVNAAKPAGLVPEYVVTEEPLATDPYIDEGTLLIENALGEIETATLADIT